MRFPIRASVYLLNVKFINCLRCFPIGGRDARGIGSMRARKMSHFGIYLGGSFVKFEYSCFLRVYSTSFSLARIDGKKISPFLKAIHRVFLLLWSNFNTTFHSRSPVRAQLCEISLFGKFFKLLHGSTSFLFFCNFSYILLLRLVTKIISTNFLRVLQKFRNLKIFQTKIEM